VSANNISAQRHQPRARETARLADVVRL